jgi:tRNA (cytosine49-C5)-methyltransferase
MKCCILTNRLKMTSKEVVKKIKEELSCQLEVIPWCPHAFFVECDKESLTHNDVFTQGLYYLQNASSLIPVCVLDPRPGESILDLAAAPGGKTIHIGIRMNNEGTIIANDVSTSRIQRMKRLLDMYDIVIAKTTCIPGQKLWEEYSETFDRVLVDAPCSMRGTPTPSEDDPKDLAKMQKWLLRSAYSSCKPGGTIAYSTCTTTLEENEEVIDWIVKKESGNISIEDISLDNSIMHTNGLKNGANGQALDSSISKTVRIAQNDVMEGFYVAKLRKSDNPIKHKHI